MPRFPCWVQAEEEDLLIYNWAPTYTGKASGSASRPPQRRPRARLARACLRACLRRHGGGPGMRRPVRSLHLRLAYGSSHDLTPNRFVPPSNPPPASPPPQTQHKYKGQEVDFVESYFFPMAPEFQRRLAARRQQRGEQRVAAAAEEAAAAAEE